MDGLGDSVRLWLESLLDGVIFLAPWGFNFKFEKISVQHFRLCRSLKRPSCMLMLNNKGCAIIVAVIIITAFPS